MPFQAIANLCKAASDDPFKHVRVQHQGLSPSKVRELVVRLLGLAQSTWVSIKSQNSNSDVVLNNTYSNAKMGEQGYTALLP